MVFLTFQVSWFDLGHICNPVFKVIDICAFFLLFVVVFFVFYCLVVVVFVFCLSFFLFFSLFWGEGGGGAQLNAYVVCILLIGKCFESSVILYVI